MLLIFSRGNVPQILSEIGIDCSGVLQLFPHTQALCMSTLKSVLSLKLEDMQTFYRTHFLLRDITLCVKNKMINLLRYLPWINVKKASLGYWQGC